MCRQRGLLLRPNIMGLITIIITIINHIQTKKRLFVVSEFYGADNHIQVTKQKRKKKKRFVVVTRTKRLIIIYKTKKEVCCCVKDREAKGLIIILSLIHISEPTRRA